MFFRVDKSPKASSIHPYIKTRLLILFFSLFVKARHVGYKRGKNTQKPTTSIVQLENVNSSDDAKWYLGKRVVFAYRGRKADKNGSKTRTISGKITSVHGNSGSVKARFTTALPPKSFGASLRVVC